MVERQIMTQEHRKRILEQINRRVTGEMRRSLASMPELPVRMLANLVLDDDEETANAAKNNPTWIKAVLETSILFGVIASDFPLSWWSDLLNEDD